MNIKNRRLNFVLGLFFLLSILILGKLFFVQIMNRGFYRALAEGQQRWFLEVRGGRGEFFLKDKNNNPYVLATNSSKKLCYLRPEKIKDKERTAKIISEILGLDESLILEKMGQEGQKGLQLLKTDLTDKEFQGLKEENLPGLYFEEQTKRVYPQKELAAQVVGFLGGQGRGQYGLEGFYDNILQGKRGWLMGEKNPWGLSLDTSQNEAQKGADLVLTLDYNIQEKAERLLEKGIKDLGAEGGEILVISPEDGRIFALSNFPNFDLNSYGEVKSQEVFQDSVLQKLFEPGSVFKPIVMASALQEEKITPETTYVDKGFVKFGKYTIYNYGQRTWGKQTMEQVLQKSINTGAIFAESRVGDKKFLEYIKRFGFFEPTGIDLQGEVYSENKNLQKGRAINFATAAFGQGVEVTSIQLARAFSAIANGGKLIRPYIVEKVIQPDGGVVETNPEIQRRDIISQRVANQLTTMLVSVVEEGFGKGAKIPNYYIAGKTGTAQVAFSALGVEKAGYSEKTVQSFIGFFPAFEPKFLVLVKLNNPQTKTAEYSAIPIFRELAKYIIDYWGIPPDYE